MAIELDETNVFMILPRIMMGVAMEYLEAEKEERE